MCPEIIRYVFNAPRNQELCFIAILITLEEPRHASNWISLRKACRHSVFENLGHISGAPRFLVLSFIAILMDSDGNLGNSGNLGPPPDCGQSGLVINLNGLAVCLKAIVGAWEMHGECVNVALLLPKSRFSEGLPT